MNFVAIDVETANSDYSSICQIGIAKYVNGKLSDEWESFLDPEDEFSRFHTYIHGIECSTVKGAPKFSEIAHIVSNYISNQVVICHTHFDRVSVQRTYEKYDMNCPNTIWLDTAKVARRAWDKFAWSGYGLINICTEFGYKYKYHDALEDAKAAAFVLLKAIEETGIELEEWLKVVEGKINSKPGKKHLKNEVNKNGPYYGNSITFTGSLRIPRVVAEELALQAGLSVQKGVNRQTDILVVGVQDINALAGKLKSNKQLKAEKMNQEGYDISIISEREFNELVDCPEYDEE